MRKHLILFLVLLLTASGLRSNPVSLTQAQKVAETFLSGHGLRQARLTDITAQSSYHEFYIFAMEGGGFILIAGDDATQPVLAYSEQNSFPAEQIPAHVRFWLDQYERFVAANNAQGTPRHADWEMLLSGVLPPEDYTAVSPLMITTWNQSPYYNDLCPWDSTYNARTVTGCVATATAQIMKYWNHPTTGYSSHSYMSNYGVLSADFGGTTYQWSQMPNALNSSSTSAQVNAVATLMYHIGVADEMRYGPSATGGSGGYNYASWGAYNDCSSQNSLINYFKYAPDMQVVDRDAHGTSEFCSILRADLDLGHPVLYSGRDTSGGHSFVFDGYNASGLFHVNWGWGGHYDGYYLVGDLHPGTGGIGGNSTYTFNISNVAITNIHPNTNWGDSTTVNVTASTGGTATGSGTYSFGSTAYLSATANDGNRFAGWNGSGGYASRSFVATGGSYDFQASFESILQDDTISYCGNNSCIGGYGNSGGYVTTWGIRIPAGVADNRQLTAVELYVRSAGTYIVNIYESSILNLIYADTITFSSTGWHSFPLSTPHAIASNQPVYISFEASLPYAAAISMGCGNSDGMLWGSNFTSINAPYTLMIRAITSSTTSQISVLSNQEQWGSVSGSGTYQHSSSVTLSATPASGYQFITWQDGVSTNPRTVTVSQDATYIATFGTPPTLQHDTLYIDHYIHDTLYVDHYIHDTTIVDHYIHDTTYVDVYIHDTTYLTEYIYDTVTLQPTLFDITVRSADITQGIGAGNGRFAEGTALELAAIPLEGYRFSQWNDGDTDNPRTVTVTSNAAYEARFEPAMQEGITTLNDAGVTIDVRGTYITVTGAQGQHVRLLDMLGRTLASEPSATSSQSFRMPVTGTYFVQVGDLPARKVVVVK